MSQAVSPVLPRKKLQQAAAGTFWPADPLTLAHCDTLAAHSRSHSLQRRCGRAEAVGGLSGGRGCGPDSPSCHSLETRTDLGRREEATSQHHHHPKHHHHPPKHNTRPNHQMSRHNPHPRPTFCNMSPHEPLPSLLAFEGIEEVLCQVCNSQTRLFARHLLLVATY